MWWFVERKPRTETRENVYLMTIVSREPRQIAGFDVAYDKSPERIQAIVTVRRRLKIIGRTAFGATLTWFIRGVTCEIFTTRMTLLLSKASTLICGITSRFWLAEVAVFHTA